MPKIRPAEWASNTGSPWVQERLSFLDRQGVPSDVKKLFFELHEWSRDPLNANLASLPQLSALAHTRTPTPDGVRESVNILLDEAIRRVWRAGRAEALRWLVLIGEPGWSRRRQKAHSLTAVFARETSTQLPGSYLRAGKKEDSLLLELARHVRTAGWIRLHEGAVTEALAHTLDGDATLARLVWSYGVRPVLEVPSHRRVRLSNMNAVFTLANASWVPMGEVKVARQLTICLEYEGSLTSGAEGRTWVSIARGMDGLRRERQIASCLWSWNARWNRTEWDTIKNHISGELVVDGIRYAGSPAQRKDPDRTRIVFSGVPWRSEASHVTLTTRFPIAPTANLLPFSLASFFSDGDTRVEFQNLTGRRTVEATPTFEHFETADEGRVVTTSQRLWPGAAVVFAVK